MKHAALELADALERLAPTIPARFRDADGYRRAVADLTRRLEVVGGTFSEGGHGYAVSAFGMRATSTISPAGACRNWIAQARRKKGGV